MGKRLPEPWFGNTHWRVDMGSHQIHREGINLTCPVTASKMDTATRAKGTKKKKI